MEKRLKPMKKKVLLWSLLWGASYCLSVFILKGAKPGLPFGILFSIIPGLAFVPFMYAYLKEMNGLDEVQRRIQLEAVVWAFSFGLLLLMTLGLLELVFPFKKEDWGYLSFTFPGFMIFYFLGVFISKRRYS